MMVLKFPLNLLCCLHQRIFYFGRIWWSCNDLSYWHCWSPCCHLGRVYVTPPECQFLYLSCLSCLLTFPMIFHFERFRQSWKGIFHFGRVWQSCNEQCFWCHSCCFLELGVGHVAGREVNELLKWHKLLQPQYPWGLEFVYPLVLVTTLMVSASLYPLGWWFFWEGLVTTSWNMPGTGHRVAFKSCLQENILNHLFQFGRECWSWNDYCHLVWACQNSLASDGTCSYSVMLPPVSGCHSSFLSHGYL